MPALQSPPTSSRAKTPSGARPSTTIRNGTPKQLGMNTASRVRSTKARDNPTKDDSNTSKVRRSSGASGAGGGKAPKEKPPSKDGTAQRHAKEVEGLKDYQLGHQLGRGAFGSVYCALNWSTGETVAVKQVRFSDMPKTELNVIMQEINLLKNLHHPNIVKYHGYTKSSDSLYIILEYCEQGSLHQICKNFGKFPENLVGMYTAQVLQGLLFLHEQGVIHRDIKGANILTTKEGLVKLADFGVATNTNVGTKNANPAEGSVVGTPYWMAPEVIELSGATTASDIWSLGCTVIELLTSHPPYHNFAPMPALFRIVNDPYPPLPESASPQVKDFLTKCFQKDPNLRVSAKKLLRHPWILSAKRADTRKPEYDEAVRSVQQWNEALKGSPPATSTAHGGARRSSARPRARSRPVSSNSITSTASGQRRLGVGAASSKPAFRLGARKSQPVGELQSPPYNKTTENWDDDFEPLTTSMGGLQIADRLRPQDNFGGLFSSEKLKQYANNDTIPEVDGKVEDYDDEFEGELTVKSSLQLSKGDAIETVRPFYHPRATSDEIRHMPPDNPNGAGIATRKPERRISKDSQPRTQILRPAPQRPSSPTAIAGTEAQSGRTSASVLLPAARKDRYREEGPIDYSDLVPDDDTAFLHKLSGFSPCRPSLPKINGSMRRRRTHTPTQLVHDAAAMKRTRSSIEMQKYAEDDHDFFADLEFDGGPMQLSGVITRSPRSVSDASDFSSGSEPPKTINGMAQTDIDDESFEDPFAALEEELDEVDLERNVARDKYARLCTLVESLVSDLKVNQADDLLDEITEHLFIILQEYPDVKSVIVASHGMLPILEILDECTRMDTVLRLLKTVNLILYDNSEVQENLCFVGGIPILSKFAHKKYPLEIRLQAAEFVSMMAPPPSNLAFASPSMALRSHTAGGLTLQMFVSCGGLNVLVEFLEEDFDTDAGRKLVLIGVDGIWSVFELQGATPKNDFCRIFSRSAVLYPLSLVLNRVLDERTTALSEADEQPLAVIEGRIVNIFLLFSQAENYVKEAVADRMVLKRVLKDLKRLKPQHQVIMLRFIKNLSMLSTTLDPLQNSNAIDELTDLLKKTLQEDDSSDYQYSREITNNLLATLFNLTRLSKSRQEDAALAGIVPLLLNIIKGERPLKEFAIPILCDMAHSGKVGRKVLWQNKGVAFYVDMVQDPFWFIDALDAIAVWAQEETAKVEEHLLEIRVRFRPKNKNAAPKPAMFVTFADVVIQCFHDSAAASFESLLEPLQRLLRLSPPVAASLATRLFFERSGVKLHSTKAVVRLNLLRIIRSVCDARAGSPDGSLLQKFGLLENVQDLARNDQAILVREMANELLKSCEISPSVPSSRAGFGLRRSSSSLSVSTTPGTPTDRRAYFDLPSSSSGIVTGSSAARASPYHHAVAPRDASSGSTLDRSSNLAAARTSRLNSRQSTAALLGRPTSRLSLAPSVAPSSANLCAHNLSRRAESVTGREISSGSGSSAAATPTHVPPSANTRAAALAQQRRRRQTSGGEIIGR